jgi:LacI family transcriptional regulator
MVTIKDVARKSGFSIKTVSRVVNGLPEVSPDTREKIQQVITELGYQPNTMARNLVNGRTNTVGVIIPPSVDFVFSHPFFNEVLRGIGTGLNDKAFNLFLYLNQTGAPYSQLYFQRQIDGLILMNIPIGDSNLQGLVESGIPSVFTCRISEGKDPINWVDADFTSGVEQAVDYLVSLGHRRIALLAGPECLVSVRLRIQGYRNGLAKHNIPLHEEYILGGDFASESGYALAKTVMQLDNRPSALMCGDDMMAFGTIQALKEMGYRVPEDVSVIGFDDISLARFSSPPLTTVRQDSELKGRLTAETLLALIDSKGNYPLTQIMLPTSLIVRESTAPVSID